MCGVVEIRIHAFLALTSALDGGEWAASLPVKEPPFSID
jgi:hypothetical protein